MTFTKVGFHLFVLVFIITFVSSCRSDKTVASPEPEEPKLTTAQQYFVDIALDGEFVNGYDHIRKWVSDIKVFVPDTSYAKLNKELHEVIEELNAISEEVDIYIVGKRSKANYIVYFGDVQTYVNKFEPNASDAVDANLGLFWIYWNENHEIYEGSMYVDVYRTKKMACQKHLLREEFTQSLGLMNDSNQYKNSIFYRDWYCTTDYTELDKKLIKFIQSEEMNAGMNKKGALSVIKNLNNK